MAPRTTRRRPAAAGRILATGLSTSAFFGSVAMIARHEQAADAAAPAVFAPVPGPPATTAPVAPVTPSIVEVHRTVYVDEAGNPVPAPDPSLPLVAVPAREAAAQTTSVALSPEAGPAPVAPRSPSVVTTVAARTAGGTAPTETTPVQTAPPQTAPPETAPPQTAPPETAPPATQPPAPAPTAPSCSGSSC